MYPSTALLNNVGRFDIDIQINFQLLCNIQIKSDISQPKGSNSENQFWEICFDEINE